jgi:hypothetical protein
VQDGVRSPDGGRAQTLRGHRLIEAVDIECRQLREKNVAQVRANVILADELNIRAPGSTGVRRV